MKTVSIHDAKTNLSKYIAAAKQGEQIFIGHRGEPEVELVYRKPGAKEKVYRKLGPLKGRIWLAPDAFSRETDGEIAKRMLGEA